MCACVCVCVRARACVCVCACACVYACVRACVRASVRARMYVPILRCVMTYLSMLISCVLMSAVFEYEIYTHAPILGLT